MGTNKSLPAAIKIYKGLSIYRVDGSMNWYVRIWDTKKKKCQSQSKKGPSRGVKLVH